MPESAYTKITFSEGYQYADEVAGIFGPFTCATSPTSIVVALPQLAVKQMFRSHAGMQEDLADKSIHIEACEYTSAVC